MTESTIADSSESRSESSGSTLSPAQQRRSVLAVVSGNFLEWFDWTIYAILTPYLAANFFDKSNPTSALLSTLAVFAVGFLARPLGGFVFGRLGDSRGRKFSLVFCMCLMGFGSLMIAVLPTYDQVGVWASVLLIVARLIQGLAHGGESGVAYTYLAEISPPEKRGLWGSSIMFTITVGVMAATLLGIILTAVLGKTEMNEWGWRIAFGIGAALALIALVIRRGASESHHFTSSNQSGDGTVKQTFTRRQMTIIAVRILLLSLLTQVLYYTWMSFFAAYAISSKGMDANGAYIASFLAQAIALITLPFWGHLSDRIGRKKQLTAWAIAVIIIVFPVSWIITDAPWSLFVAQGMALIVWAMQSSIFSTVIAEQAPTEIRATSVGVWASVAAALAGGTAPYLNTWLTSIGMGWVFSVYIITLALVTIVTLRFIPETAGLRMDQIPLPER